MKLYKFNGVPIVVSRDSNTDVKGDVLDLQHLENTINHISAKTGCYPTEILVSPSQLRDIEALMTGMRNDLKIGDWVLVGSKIFELTRLHPLAGKNVETGEHRAISISSATKVPKDADPDYLRTLYGTCD